VAVARGEVEAAIVVGIEKTDSESEQEPAGGG